MISTRVSLLERFGICSVLIPYFGKTHQSFLLLSILSRKSREMLDGFYEEFLNCLIKNIICVTIDEEYHKNMIFLPCNLFRFEMILNCEVLVNSFLELTENINSKRGFYFKEHYMHSRLCIDVLRTNESFVHALYPSLEILKAIEVIDYISEFYTIKKKNILSIKRSPLIDKFSLIGCFEYNYVTHSFPHYLESDGTNTIINPVFESFRKIHYLNYQYHPVSTIIEYLTETKDLNLKIENICLNGDSADEYEELSNPDYFCNEVNHIKFCTDDANALSNKFLNNINAVRPKRLTLMLGELGSGDFDIIKILTNIKFNLNLELLWYIEYTMLKLSFNDTPILIQSNQQKPIIIKCKKFSCNISINEIDKVWHIIEKSNNIHNNETQFLIIKSSGYFQFNDFELIEREEEIKSILNEFPKHLSDNNLELIIPIKCLDSIDIDNSQAVGILNSLRCDYFIKLISKAPHISCSVKMRNLQRLIDYFTDLFPPRCLYSISEDDIFKTETYPSQTEIDKYSNENSSDFIEKLEFINISEIRYELLLSSCDFQFISDIISSPNIQINLRKVDLTTNNLNESLQLLNSLSECKNLESIELKYRDKLVYDICENEIDTIRNAINEFYKKAGVISKVKIYHKE